tara:strand:- start:19 stop:585 length:567 start_codon:yes stop_codon:yes gene_type:complete
MKKVFLYIVKKWWISPITAIAALLILKIIEYFVGQSIFLLSNLPDNRPFLIIEMIVLIICLITFLTSSISYLIKKRWGFGILLLIGFLSQAFLSFAYIVVAFAFSYGIGPSPCDCAEYVIEANSYDSIAIASDDMSGMSSAIFYLELEGETKLSYNLRRCLIKRGRAGFGAFLDDYWDCINRIKPNDN